MMVTEKEARGLICPQTMARGPIAHSGNHELAPCVGSGCMAWRWGRWHDDGHPFGTERGKPTHGYCGLSGAVP
jgi:hypothetical protein